MVSLRPRDFPQTKLTEILDGEYLTGLYGSGDDTKDTTPVEAYVMYREYYDGDHDTKLTERAASFLETDPLQEFNVNACPIVVDAKAERLAVTAFDAGEDSEQVWEWWQANRMDAQQGIVHTAAIRDGDSYVIAEWDNEENRPRWSFELASDGTEGVKVHYSQERRGKIEFASKRWKVKWGPGGGKAMRINLYFPDHVEKYISTEGAEKTSWLPFFADADSEQGEPGEDGRPFLRDGHLGQTAWSWWTDTGQEGGKPLGVSVVHFKNLDQGYDQGKSELKDVIPLQNALNKVAIDLVVETDVSAFRILTMIGADPSDLEIYPGGWVWSENPDVEIGALPAGNVQEMIQVKDSFFMDIARVTRTPISYFQVTGQRPSDQTLKQEESGLVARVNKAQLDFGNVWEDLVRMSMRLHNAFASDAEPMDDKQSIRTVWNDPETRNRLMHLQSLVLERDLGVDTETIWENMSYDADKRKTFRKALVRDRSLGIRSQSILPTANGGQNGNEGDAAARGGQRIRAP